MRAVLAFILLTATATAQDFVLAVKQPWTNNVPDNVRVLDFSGPRRTWGDDLRDYVREHADLVPGQYPALVWLKAGVIVPVTGTVAQAKQDCKAALQAGKPDFWTRAERQWTNNVNSIASRAGTNVVAVNQTPWDIYRLLKDVPSGSRDAAYRDAVELLLIGAELQLRNADADAKGRKLNWLDSMKEGNQ